MPQKFMGAIVVACLAALCLLALFGGNLWLMGLGILIPVGVFIVGKREFLMLAALWTYNSTLRIPGVPGDIDLSQLLMVAFCAVSVAHAIILPQPRTRSADRVLAILFAAVVLMVMAVRGAGFRQLGGSLWGGARYIDILVRLAFFLFASNVAISERQWKWGLLGMILSGAIPTLAELLYIVSNGRIYQQYLFVLPAGTTGVASYQFEAGNMARFTRMAKLAPVYLLPFLFWRKTPGKPWRYLAFCGLGLVFGGFSGHRIVLVMITLYIWLYFFLKAKRKFSFVAVSTASGAVILLTLGQLAPLMPLPFQRMLSVVPFARVDAMAAADAASTVTWRLHLWKRAIALIPEYLWIGKGYAFPIALAQAQDVKLLPHYHLWWAMVQSAYHQGLLSLVIGLGLPGLITGLAFLVATFRKHLRLSRRDWCLPSLQHLHYAILVLFTAQAIEFVAIYGDVHVSYPTLFLHAGLLGALYTSDQAARKRESDAVDV